MRAFFTQPNNNVNEIEIDAADVVSDDLIIRIRNTGVLVTDKNHKTIVDISIANKKIKIENND